MPPIRTTRAAVVRDCLLRKVFGYKEGDLTVEWSKQHDFELREFYSCPPPHHPHHQHPPPHLHSGAPIRANETGRAPIYMAKGRNGYAGSLEKPEGNGQDGKRSLRWKDNISVNFKGI
jgi:hypothetical protein